VANEKRRTQFSTMCRRVKILKKIAFLLSIDLQYAKPYNLIPELSLYAGEKKWKFNMEP
jgi:hypothetical protein